MKLLKRSALLSVCSLVSWEASAQTRAPEPTSKQAPAPAAAPASDVTAAPSTPEKEGEARVSTESPKSAQPNERAAPQKKTDAEIEPPGDHPPSDSQQVQPLAEKDAPPSERPNPYEDIPHPYQIESAAPIHVIDTSKGVKTPAPKKEKINPSTLPFTYHQRHFDLGLGFKVQSARDNSLQPFVENEVLGAFSVRGGGVVWTTGSLALAVNAEFDTTTVNSNVRYESSRLNLTGLNLGVEARHHFHHRLYVSLRLAPVAEYAVMRIGDEHDSAHLKDNNWAFGADARGGIAFRFAGSSDGRKRLPRAWVLLEAGGQLMSKHDVSLLPEDDGPQRPEPVELDSFTSSGALFALSVMASY